MSWMGSDETSSVKETMKSQSEAMFKVLDSEMRKLKLKAVRCAGNCLKTKPDFREALHCEHTCLNSITHMKTFMDTRTQSTSEELKQCLYYAEASAKGEGPEDGEGFEYSLNCYHKFMKQMAKMQDEVVVEFSYFE